MSPMFKMIEKIIAPLDISNQERLNLCKCLDLAYAIGAGDMVSRPEMPGQALLIFDKRMNLIKELKLFEGD